MVAVGDVGIDIVFLRVLNARLAGVTGIGGELRFVEHVLGDPGRLALCTGVLDQRCQQVGLLTFSVRLGGHHDLVLGIDHGNAVVALNHAVVGGHLGAVGVGDVALSLVAAVPEVRPGGLEEAFDLVDLAFVGGAFLLLLGHDRREFFLDILCLMAGHDLLCRGVQFLLLVAQLLEGAAPLLRGVAGQFAAVDGEGVLADQVELTGVHQYIREHAGDFLAHLRDAVRDRGEVRAGVGGQGHEHDVALAAIRQLAAGDDALVIAVQHDLEQHRRVVGQAAGFIVAVARGKR